MCFAVDKSLPNPDYQYLHVFYNVSRRHVALSALRNGVFYLIFR